MRLNMRESFLITLLLVALLPLLAISVLNWYILSSEEINDRKEFLDNYIVHTRNLLDENRDHLEIQLKYISRIMDNLDYAINKKNSQELQSLMQDLRETSEIDFVGILDLDNTVMIKSREDMAIKKLDLPDYTREVFDGKTIISTTTIGRKNSIFIYGLTPLYGTAKEEGKVIGVLFAGHLLQKEMFQIKKQIKPFPALHIDIVSSSSEIEDNQNTSLLPIKNYAGEQVASIVVWFDPGAPPSMVNLTSANYVIIFIVAAVFVFVLAYFVSKAMVKPLEKLNRATDEVAKDNFDIDTTVKGPVEVEHLGQAFGKMAESLKDKKQMRENFISTLTHDMRVPLLAEQKALHLLLMDDRFQTSSDQKMLLANMQSSNTDLILLVNTLLDTYKLEAGKYTITKTKNDLVKTIQECVNELKPLADDKRQVLLFHNQPEELMVLSDRLEIKRVLKNLLSNAIKFTDIEGKIEVKLSSDSDIAQVAVSDTGKGMSKEEQERLFEQYYSGAKKLRKVGTGLGLYLSYQLINSHGGKIWVDSTQGEGSTFYFSLPLNE